MTEKTLILKFRQSLRKMLELSREQRMINLDKAEQEVKKEKPKVMGLSKLSETLKAATRVKVMDTLANTKHNFSGLQTSYALMYNVLCK